MTVAALLTQLNQQSIKLGLDADGRLKVRAPKGALTPALRQVLADNKPALLDWLRERENEVPPIRPVSRDRDLPLSYAQQRLWVLEQVEGAGAVYSVPATMRMKGLLDMVALRGAFQAVVARHEVLRTAFVLVNHQPVQRIEPKLDFKVEYIDLSLQADPPEAAAQAIKNQLGRPFNLAEAPMLRALVYRLGDNDHVVFVNMHHVVTDGVSLGIFMAEFTAFYRALCEGTPHTLPPLSIQYADYAVWQREHVNEARRNQQIQYWHKQLAGLPTDVGFPTDMPRPERRGSAGAVHGFTTTPAVQQALETMARETGAGIFTVLMTAFQIWQGYYRNSRDVVAGTDFGGRNHREIERLIGFFVNQVVIRTNISGNPSFRELVRKTNDTIHQAHAHASLPFESVVEALGGNRDLSRPPVFQNKFVWQTVQHGAPSLPNLTVEPYGQEKNIAKFDVLLNMSAGDEGLRGNLQYSTDLFKPDTIRRMTSVFVTLLETVTNDVVDLETIHMAMQQQDQELRKAEAQSLAAVSLGKLGRRRRR